MTPRVQDLLTAFDALAPEEQQIAAAEILRRSAGAGDLPDAAFNELAAKIFQEYDAEEAEGADR